MTAAVPAERVAEILMANGYRRLPSPPLLIAGLTFDVAAAFDRKDNSADLVIVADTAAGERKVVQQIAGIARALDVVRSQRSMTSVIVGPRPVGKALEALSRVSRVLAVEEAVDAGELRDKLAILLPLEIPKSLEGDQQLSASEEIDVPDDPLAVELRSAANQGEGAVSRRFHEALNAVFHPEGEEDVNSF
jgi:hypothetical protein